MELHSGPSFCASPDSPMHVDWDAVRLVAQQGTKCAFAFFQEFSSCMDSIGNILEDDAVLVAPRNGREFRGVPFAANALVVTCARLEAKAYCPSCNEFEVVDDATSLAEGIAKWMGLHPRCESFPPRLRLLVVRSSSVTLPSVVRLRKNQTCFPQPRGWRCETRGSSILWSPLCFL